MWRKVGLVIALIMLVLPVSLSGVNALASTGTVDGMVLFDGAPLVGVEVWLRVGDTGRYTCTDASGHFVFTDVPFDTPLVSATGIDVDAAETCSNAMFIDYTYSRRGFPLLWQYWDHLNGGTTADTFTLTAGSPTATLQYDVVRWPIDFDRVLLNTLLSALNHLERGNKVSATRAADRFIARVERLQRRGTITAAEAASLISDAEFFRDVAIPAVP